MPGALAQRHSGEVSMRVDGRVRPLIIAVKLTHRTVLHATDSFSTSLPPLPAESATRLALTVHYHIRLASAVLILHTGRLDCRHCVVTRSLSILIWCVYTVCKACPTLVDPALTTFVLTATAGISLLLRRRIYQGICRASNQYCPRVLPGFSCISPVAYRKCMSVTLLGLLVGIATDK